MISVFSRTIIFSNSEAEGVRSLPAQCDFSMGRCEVTYDVELLVESNYSFNALIRSFVSSISDWITFSWIAFFLGSELS